MSSFDPDDFVVLYPGVYTEKEKALEECPAEVRTEEVCPVEAWHCDVPAGIRMCKVCKLDATGQSLATIACIG